MHKAISDNRLFVQAVTVLFGSLFMAAIFRNIWASDDAYIFFRSIDQLMAGNGPRWNIVDRVQVYTSPLWFWIMSIATLFNKNIYLNVVTISLVLDMVLVILLFRFFNDFRLWVFALSLLAISSAFMDFTTSGLEYPLIFLECGLFFSQLFYFCKEPSEKLLKNLCLLGSIFLITRHDLLLTILPTICYGFWQMRRNISLRRLAWFFCLLIGPLFLWTIFSTVYYGVPLPNTAYAKLGLKNVPHLQLIEQGIFYFYWGLKTDIISVLVILSAIISGFASRSHFNRLLSATLLLVVIYILWVSGDFMAGRFYAHLVLISVLQLLTVFKDKIEDVFASALKWIPLAAAIVLYAVFYPHNPLNTPNIYRDSIGEHRVSGERGNYSAATSIWVYLDSATPYFPYFIYFEQAHHFGEDGRKSQRFEGVGMIGYGAKLDFYIDDFVALSDFFRARMPMDDDDGWMTGHSTRYYPEGYPQSLIDRKANLKDPYLNQYLSVVMTLTQDEDLWSRNRLLTILKFNLGMYDDLLEKANLHWTPREEIENRACYHSWQHSKWLRLW